MKRFEARNSKTPGPRTRVTLDIAEVSLPVLLAGIEAVRCWLTDKGEGVYTFHATQTMGQAREQPGRPSMDVLVELVNELGDALDGDDVPARLRDLWDDLVRRYLEATDPVP